MIKIMYDQEATDFIVINGLSAFRTVSFEDIGRQLDGFREESEITAANIRLKINGEYRAATDAVIGRILNGYGMKAVSIYA